MLAACALALVGAAPEIAQATTEGNSGRIAFDRRGARGSDLFVVASQGAGERRLPISATGANDSRPAWAPAGRWRGFNDFGVVSPGATVEFDLAPPRVPLVRAVSFNGVPSPTVGQTGDHVSATVPAGATTGRVCVISAAGYVGAPNLVQSTPVGDVTIPGTARDPERGCESQPVAFQSDRTGDYDVWAANPDESASAADLVPWKGSNETQPAWSNSTDAGIPVAPELGAPLLAFTSDRAGDRNIYILDTGQPNRPGINPSRVTTNRADDANPDFSLSGRFLTFQSDRAGQSDIWAMGIQRGASGGFVAENRLLKITPDAPPSYDPSWFWFGLNPTVMSAIAFSGPEENGTCAINYLAWPTTDDVPPPNPRQLDTLTLDAPPAGADGPSWSPYGAALSFQAGDSQRTGIFSLSTDDTTPVSALALSRPGRHPNWQALAYNANPTFFRPFGRRHKRRPRPSARSAKAVAGSYRRPSARVAQVAAPCAAPPSARLDVEPASPKPNQRVTLDAHGSETPGGRVDRYEWDLDADGTYDARTTAPTLTKRWSTIGRRTVAVRVTDDDGATDIARSVVTVSSSPLGKPTCTKVGTPRPDRLQGTSRRDVLCGLGGNDLLLGLGGNDVLLGGPGKDRLHGGPGADRLRGDTGADLLRGGRGDNLLWGGGGRDQLYGDRGRDRLDGQSGGDRLWGGGGRDRLYGDRGRDRLDGQSGVDRLWGGADADLLTGGPGNDWLWGGPAGDTVTGGSGRDKLSGGGGRDRLLAKDGRRDLVDGGTQRDRAVVDQRLDRVRRVERVTP